MFLDLNQHKYETDVIPFIKNGIIIDTSVIDIIVEGLIETRIAKKKLSQCQDYQNLLVFFDLMKLTNKFDRFCITPHILTEVCNHFRNRYSKRQDYAGLIDEVMPLMRDFQEHVVEKTEVLNRVDLKNPVIEIGDLSIFVAADAIVISGKKIAILSRDRELNRVYASDSKVLVMDFESVVLNRV